MRDRLGVAVVGCGFFGRMHAEVYAELPDAHPVAVFDANPDTAREVASRVDARAHTSLDELLDDPSVQAVDVCVPDDQHTEVVLAALEREMPVLVEKPLATTVADARRIQQAAQGSNVPVQVGHILRFNPGVVAAYERIRRGELGEISYVHSRRASPVAGARHYAAHSEVVVHSGIHDIDLVRWLVGAEYRSVFARGRRLVLAAEGLPAHDAITATFTFDDGVLYTLQNSWSLPEAYPAYIEAQVEIVGTAGAVRLDFGAGGLQVVTDRVEHPDLAHWPRLLGERAGDLRTEVAHFVDCVRTGRPPRVSVTDGAAAVAAASTAVAALNADRPLEIEPIGGP